MSKPFFSIVIPTYNRTELTIEAVQSVLNQTFSSFEIWVIDDAGTDNLKEQLKYIKDSRLNFKRLEKNSGANGARNEGIRRANGSWIAFLDSDDVWLSDYLEKSQKFINKKNIQKGTLYSSLQYQRPDGSFQIKPRHSKKHETEVLTYLFREDGLMQTSGLIIDAATIKSVLFDINLPRHNDLDLVWRLEKSGCKFYFNDTQSVIWRSDLRSDRISIEKNYEKSLIWYEIFSPQVPYHTRAAFRALYLAPNLPLIKIHKHLYYILAAFFSIPLKKTCAALLRCFLPSATYEKIAAKLNNSR